MANIRAAMWIGVAASFISVSALDVTEDARAAEAAWRGTCDAVTTLEANVFTEAFAALARILRPERA